MLLPRPLATIRLPSGPDLETTCTHATWSNAVKLEMHTAAEASMLSSIDEQTGRPARARAGPGSIVPG